MQNMETYQKPELTDDSITNPPAPKTPRAIKLIVEKRIPQIVLAHENNLSSEEEAV